MKIEGIPDGWELVRIGTPMLKEYYISMSGTICKCSIIPDGKAYVIIRKIEKPKQIKEKLEEANV